MWIKRGAIFAGGHRGANFTGLYLGGVNFTGGYLVGEKFAGGFIHKRGGCKFCRGVNFAGAGVQFLRGEGAESASE
jgi:hypothetical protein